ncbi:hypothetical protein GQ53DRAFT_649066 [Thozetella sp. PMI_491]|nr:hypothetical protein GQ53DRAFT_649066 [Thozetella sp. PMI_491]
MLFALWVFLHLRLASATLFDRSALWPPIHDAGIENIVFAGSGCPAGSVTGDLSDDLAAITLLYDNLTAQAGNGVPASEYRKNCQLNFKINYSSGWQFSVVKADYRGYAQLPTGDSGTTKATYYFSGDSQQFSSAMTIDGPYEGDYIKIDQIGLDRTVWSPCGREALFNINSEVRLSPSDATNHAMMTVRLTDLKFTQVHYLQWQTC